MEKSKEKFMVSRWVPKFPGFQVHKWTKQRFHESREKNGRISYMNFKFNEW